MKNPADNSKGIKNLVSIIVMVTMMLGCDGKGQLGNSPGGNADRPNIVLVVTDDQGWADVGYQGSKDIPTPTIDRLANEGVQFQAGYVSHPYCAPSRAGILTQLAFSVL